MKRIICEYGEQGTIVDALLDIIENESDLHVEVWGCSYTHDDAPENFPEIVFLDHPTQADILEALVVSTNMPIEELKEIVKFYDQRPRADGMEVVE